MCSFLRAVSIKTAVKVSGDSVHLLPWREAPLDLWLGAGDLWSP